MLPNSLELHTLMIGAILFLSIIGIVSGGIILGSTIKSNDMNIRIIGGGIVGLSTFIFVIAILVYI